MKDKLTTGVAFTGLLLVLTAIISRFGHFLTVDQRTAFYIIGFSMMLLGTIWKVVLEMNEKEN